MPVMAESTVSSEAASAIAARQRRLRLLARADRLRLEAALLAWQPLPPHRRLKPAETGLAMIRARAGGNGQRFNLGEVTVSRCVVALDDADGKAVMGVGYLHGRDRRQAELIALLDALAERSAPDAARLEHEVLAPLEQELAAAAALKAAQVAATKVDFFTMVRGED